jgi:perosamine synthetase
MSDAISMSAADIDENDERAVLRVLRSGVLALGPETERFEELVAERSGARYGIAVSSGTAGLHLIVRALGIAGGDEVLVPSFTFAASVNALLLEGASPVFCDISPDTYNVSPYELRARRTDRTAAAMVVDVFGHPADWERIEASLHDLELIDDCCEAMGATFKGRPMGSFGRAGCFGFYPNKQMTTGEGGMIVTDDERLAATCRSQRNHGRSAMGAWLEHEQLGLNYRIDEMSAALGVSQVTRLEDLLRKREAVAAFYSSRLGSLGWLRTQVIRPEVRMSWFVYVITLDASIDREAVIERMAAEGIPTRAYFSPLHLQPYIRERFGTREGMLPVTEDIARRTVALPFHGHLTEAQVDRVVDALTRAVQDA